MVKKITSLFIEKFEEEPTVFRSPGRINILGEHTDYNEGFVLPAAINKHIYIAITKRTDNTINLYAADFNESFTADVENISRASIQWPNYILGVVDQLQKNGHVVKGFDLVIDGDEGTGAAVVDLASFQSTLRRKFLAFVTSSPP